MRQGLSIVDAHMHLFSRAVFERECAALANASDEYRQGYAIWKAGFTRRFNAPFAEDPRGGSDELANRWGRLLDEAGVDKACFIATDPDSSDLTDFVARNPSRFYAIATADPHDPDAPSKLKTLVKGSGYRGLKLYPTTGHFSLADKMLYPLFEEADSLEIPVVIHFGITLDYNADMRYSDPSSLHAAARDFPRIPFIIPHFAAGYFRELLFLCYHVPNIYVDTSGTNRWMQYLPIEIRLQDVFKKTLAVLGPDHILFGTDSRMLSQGYRINVLEEQEQILNNLSLSNEEKSLVMSENATRLYHLN